MIHEELDPFAGIGLALPDGRNRSPAHGPEARFPKRLRDRPTIPPPKGRIQQQIELLREHGLAAPLGPGPVHPVQIGNPAPENDDVRQGDGELPTGRNGAPPREDPCRSSGAPLHQLEQALGLLTAPHGIVPEVEDELEVAHDGKRVPLCRPNHTEDL